MYRPSPRAPIAWVTVAGLVPAHEGVKDMIQKLTVQNVNDMGLVGSQFSREGRFAVTTTPAIAVSLSTTRPP
jgi:hypothetical protein